MLYTEILKNAKNYIAKIEVPGAGSFTGLVDDDSISMSLGVNLNDGGMAGGGVAQAIEKKVLGDSNIVSNLTGMDSVTKQTEAYSLRKPVSWENPSITLKVTFFSGVDIGGQIINFKSFNNKIAKATLPKKNSLGILESEQISYELLSQIITSAATSGVTGFDSIRDKLTKISIGSFFHSSGWWLTGAPTNIINVYDNNGSPVIWDTTFSFAYFKQLTNQEWSSFFQ